VIAGTTSSPGSALNRLNGPFNVFFNGYGYMYVVDYANHRIQLFQPGSVKSHTIYLHCLFSNLGSSSSTSATNVAGYTWSSSGGSGYSEFSYPTAIYVDLDGTMYILDYANYRVVKWLVGQPLGFSIAGNHGLGSTLDKMGTCYGLYLDNQKNIYISDYTNHRVTMWYNGNTTAGILVSSTVWEMND
jgi:DNA-binding beta-propeller fold protein YncE